MLVDTGEKLTDIDVDTILKLTGTEEDLDGNIKYEGSCYWRVYNTFQWQH